MAQITGRFAPSPSGRMHLGNVFCALMAWLSVRSQGGRMLLRIEDLDPDRCRLDYAARLEEDLRWLGLDWDAGGLDSGMPSAYCQRTRTAFYAAQFEKLERMELIYPCYCSRAELHAASAPHQAERQQVYSGRCKALSPAARQAHERAGRRPAWRLCVPDEVIGFEDRLYGPVRQNLAEACGDFVVRRSDGVYAYQLAVVADDGLMGVTEVVRGRDLCDSTPRQLYLYRLLGLPAPRFTHLPLLCAPDGRRLSKRERDLDMGALRQRFPDSRVLIGRLAQLAGQHPDGSPISAQALVPYFDAARIPREDQIITPEFLSYPIPSR